MAVGSGSVTLQNIPSVPYVIDPEQFFAMTKKNVMAAAAIPDPGAGAFTARQIPQVGIVSKLRLTFVGQLVVATAAATTSDRWPHGLLDGFTLSANGQNDVVSVNGEDLAALRFARFPAFEDAVDQYPGSVAGGNSVATGTYPLHLTFDVPLAMDETSLIGSLYAQSSATNLSIRIQRALNATLFSANPANATITGTWYVQVVTFEIPFDANGSIVIPDLQRMHGLNAVEVPFANVGDVRVPLIRSAGQLSRIFLSLRSSATNRLSALPSAATTKKIDSLRLQYGGNQRPYVFDPASTLLSVNNEHYGAPLPYDRLAIDLVRENPARDVILMQGVTELELVPVVDAGVTVTAGAARVLQETLF